MSLDLYDLHVEAAPRLAIQEGVLHRGRLAPGPSNRPHSLVALSDVCFPLLNASGSACISAAAPPSPPSPDAELNELRHLPLDARTPRPSSNNPSFPIPLPEFPLGPSGPLFIPHFLSHPSLSLSLVHRLACRSDSHCSPSSTT